MLSSGLKFAPLSYEPNICRKMQNSQNFGEQKKQLMERQKDLCFCSLLSLAPKRVPVSNLSDTFLFLLPLFLPHCVFLNIFSQHDCSLPSSSFCSPPDSLSVLFGIFLFLCCPSSQSWPRAEAPLLGCGDVALQAALGRVLHLPPAFTLEARCGL